MQQRLVTALDAVTATTTSSAINIENAKKVTWLLTRANHSSGSSAFDVDVSIDGSTYVDFNGLVSNATNTNAQTITRVGSVTLSSNTSSIVAMDLTAFNFKWMKITVTETTDGTHSASALIEE